jgi:hypothetical protein
MYTHAHANPPRVDGVELIGNLLAHLNGERPLDARSVDALRHGIVASVRRGESLDVSLGLVASGQRTMQTRLLHLKRDEQLRQALAAVSLDASLSTWARCLRLAPLVRTFIDCEWPHVRRLAEPLADWPQWKVHVFRAMQADIALPRSPTGLHYVAQKAASCFSNEPGARLLSRYL